jgi:thiamine-monophosphate kinase
LAAYNPPAAGSDADETLAQLGEWELIRRLGAFAAPGRFNDDAALLEPPAGEALVVNTDVLVEGVHFSAATTAPGDVGWRAAAANLSDLAAMGCRRCLGITVGLTAPGSTAWPWVEGVYGGIHEALLRHGGELLGGDCSSGQQRQLAITALGAVDPGRVIRRGDGRPGDLLVASGPHGLSRLGLALALGELSNDLASPLPAGLRQDALRAHRRPRPRFDVVAALQHSQAQASAWRVGGTDSSDGLVAAAEAIARASDCIAALDGRRLALDPRMASLPMAEDWCLAGGEDFELVLALDPVWAHGLCGQLAGCQVIGELRLRAEGCQGRQVVWLDSGEAVAATLGGYQHFH